MSPRLFTPRFLLMFGYSFTVFTSVFQLLPTAPYRILALGGSTGAAGLFLGLLTFSSALCAPLTGPITDRIGHRRVLIVVSLLLACFPAAYAVIGDHRLLLVTVLPHGVIWSALLTASGAYMTATIPRSRRGEGYGYWGLAAIVAVGTAPVLGFWMYRLGWAALCAEIAALNLLMAFIAWRLPEDRPEASVALPAGGLARLARAARPGTALQLARRHVEWRVLGLAMGLSLVSFGYGSLTSFSALFADTIGVAPRSLFLSVMAAAVIVGRLTIGRALDRLGHRRVLVPSMVAPALGLLLVAFAEGRLTLVAAAIVFGAGFGLVHPAFTAYVMGHVDDSRRGAAFGAVLAAFDTGIGAGSSVLGWLVHAQGFRVAFAAASLIAALALPYFLAAERRLRFEKTGTLHPVHQS
jgi:MFS family permease